MMKKHTPLCVETTFGLLDKTTWQLTPAPKIMRIHIPRNSANGSLIYSLQGLCKWYNKEQQGEDLPKFRPFVWVDEYTWTADPRVDMRKIRFRIYNRRVTTLEQSKCLRAFANWKSRGRISSPRWQEFQLFKESQFPIAKLVDHQKCRSGRKFDTSNIISVAACDTPIKCQWRLKTSVCYLSGTYNAILLMDTIPVIRDRKSTTVKWGIEITWSISG